MLDSKSELHSKEVGGDGRGNGGVLQSGKECVSHSCVSLQVYCSDETDLRIQSRGNANGDMDL